jgi:hypothetical protein
LVELVDGDEAVVVGVAGAVQAGDQMRGEDAAR